MKQARRLGATRAMVVVLAGVVVMAGAGRLQAVPPEPPAADPALARAAAEARQALLARHGAGETERIDRGIAQVLRLWRTEDGDAATLKDFLATEFAPSGKARDAVFDRLEYATERLGGYFISLRRDLRRWTDLDLGPLLPLDQRLAGYQPAGHLAADLFANKIAFVVLLNFPRTTLAERLENGAGWSRRQWAETRLAHWRWAETELGQGFSARVPAEVAARVTAAEAAADAYIADYNVYMHHLVTADGTRPFPPGLRLISHWNLRDELKARYADPQGLPRQRLIQKVMERIVRQEIPQAVVNNPLLDWNPETGAVTVSPVKDADPPPTARAEARPEREPDTRYRRWLDVFQAERSRDRYHPDEPSHIARRFDVDREIPEARVESLLQSILDSPLGARVAGLVARRLGRPLEPFDVWYSGFRPGARYPEPELDALTRKKYPTPAAYAADIPRLLRQLGFAEDRARFVAEHIAVEPARGAGHAYGGARRDDKALLRTRVGKEGMDYKGYNIAIHEMGHNVEQVFSVTTIDYTLLQGVPNTAFTEALAFVFQNRDLELLGLGGPDPSAEHLRALDTFWTTREIAGVALVDMQAWRWLYAHPETTPAEFRQAVVRIAGEVWNRYYAPILGGRDVALLAVYSHLVSSSLYTPDYPLGHLIAFQIEDHFRSRPGPMGPEFERICQLGSITPDIWMRQAVGAPLSVEPLLRAAAQALDTVGSR